MFFKPIKNIYYIQKKEKLQLNNVNQNEDFDKICFDCGRPNPELISINNGIFICQDCGIEHMLFPKGTSILIKNDIKSLSEKEKEFIKYGGNKKLYKFILELNPSLINLPLKYLYTSPLLYYYQQKLQQMVFGNKEENKSKKEIFKNKLYNLQINPNYSLKEINNFLGMNSYINSSLKRFNTSSNLNINDNIYDNNDFKNKNINNKKNKCKLDDEIHNYLFTQRTNNTHANTISSNTLTYISEKTNENNNILKNSNIVYNKPRLNTFKKGKNNKLNEYKIDNFDNLKNNSTQKKRKNISENKNVNQNSEDNIISTYNSQEISKEILSKNIYKTIAKNENDSNLENNNKEILRLSVNVSNRKKYNTNNMENKEISQKPNHSERKIKEIIINKKMSKSKDNYENLFSSLNTINTKSRIYLENRKPIQVNLSLQKTYNKYQKDNNRIKKYLKDNNLNETMNNNNESIKDDNNNDKKDKKINEINNVNSKSYKTLKKTIKKYNSNKTYLNINKNLKKEFENINNSYENKKNNKKLMDDIFYDKTFNKIKNNNINNNKNKLDSIKKKIYFKYKINNDDTIENKNNKDSIIIKEEKINKKEKEEISKKKLIFNKDNVEQFQILPQKDNKYKKNKNKTFINKEKNPLVKSLDFVENNYLCNRDKKFIKRNIISENQNKSFRKLFYNSTTDLRIGETFKNSIRNKYKREKSLKKK